MQSPVCDITTLSKHHPDNNSESQRATVSQTNDTGLKHVSLHLSNGLSWSDKVQCRMLSKDPTKAELLSHRKLKNSCNADPPLKAILSQSGLPPFWTPAIVGECFLLSRQNISNKSKQKRQCHTTFTWLLFYTAAKSKHSWALRVKTTSQR